ncbi:hypothetical protein FSARC_3972 [Fusarium sarcochroum]|uniref:Beta-lactamase-related domain-containing protein n=1 Tax=Fusarium sarcochroum TaxID=1208366 RepID=A0A8H4XC10_9HYPO|nr:hypothetical protein FSARC_3972 [Fusarium sarcochroum]
MKMLLICTSFIVFCLGPTLAAADLLGPRFPPPIDVASSNSLSSKAWQNLTKTFDEYLNGSSQSPLLAGIENITFSLGAFSIHDPSAASALQYHYTDPLIQNNTVGTTKVDADSVYRFASVSKLFTAYAGMVSLTEEEWNRPFTNIFPILAESDGHGGLTEVAQWEHVTPLSLASQISGVVGNAPPFGVADMALTYLAELKAGAKPSFDPTAAGLPPITNPYPNFSEFCEVPNSDCKSDSIIKDAQFRYPTYQPWTSPTYSNHGFILLGLAIAELTNQSLPNVYRNTLFEPLGMKSSNATDPVHLTDRVVVPGGNLSFTFADSALGAASGGIYSTLNDMAKFSTSILNSTLLSEEKTRKWMKPLSHTANLNYSVGAGWEILRYTHQGTHAVTDLYTKLGDSGFNGGAVVLIPDYGAGFNCLVASADPGRYNIQRLVLDAVVREWLPALEAQAAAEAKAKYTGTYIPKDKKLNTSLTLTVEPSIGGLWVSDWISNSSDILSAENQSPIFKNTGGLRFLPSIYDAGNSKYAFRIRGPSNKTRTDRLNSYGPFTGTILDDWVITGQFAYAGTPIDLAIFDLDEAGQAVSVDLPAFNITLKRQG